MISLVVFFTDSKTDQLKYKAKIKRYSTVFVYQHITFTGSLMSMDNDSVT